MKADELLSTLTFFPRAEPSVFAFITSPIKRSLLGKWFGWEDTGQTVYVKGRLEGFPMKHTDGNWVLDLELDELRLDEVFVDLEDRHFIRVVVGGKRPAAEFCKRPEKRMLLPGDELEVFGSLIIDKTGPYAEVHPYSFLKRA